MNRTPSTGYAIGTLVKARGREWVVLPGSNDDMLMLRPLGGTDDEITGILKQLEPIAPASFALPDPNQIGDYRSCRLLRDALRLGFRSSAGPFRSFGKIAVQPRPYQLVPLLMALKLDPVRLLIADDVGIGKTIEAGLIARELLDRGEIERMAVLCPPQLAEQWQKELNSKFHLDFEVVLPSTASRLEKHCRMGESLFERFPFVIVSLDFIKSDRRRDEFLRTCPEFVIIDEAHTCAFAMEKHRGRHQRYQLVSGLAADSNRHLILVTATPHSGKEEHFRSLLSFLNPDFATLPSDLTGQENESHRRRLAQHFIQRRRGDIKAYLGEDTRFPTREEDERHYTLSKEYKSFFEKVIRYARETVTKASDRDESRFTQRVRWWSALALLRSLASSPAAAAITLRTRAAGVDTETADEADEIGRAIVMDLLDQESDEGIDMTPGSDVGELAEDEKDHRQKLLAMAREAEALKGAKDTKLQACLPWIEKLLKQDYQPIIFCRFIPTAEYLAEAMRSHLPNDVVIAAVTGTLPPAERETRILQLAQARKRLLVCTDCLSEGINLQDHFNAVFHYDLSWNPTRHEQREGRVDRFGQQTEKVAVVTYYGLDNQIDGIVLDVLLRKHKTIRGSLGISVPVPANTDQVMEAIFEGLLLRQKSGAESQLYLPGFEEVFKPQQEALHREWDTAHDREKRSRSIFAQVPIKVEEVTQELQAMRAAIGSHLQVADFVKEALRAHGVAIGGNGVLDIDMRESPTALKDLTGQAKAFRARFDLPVDKGELYLSRTHPFTEGLATYILDTALDPLSKSVARRCGVIRTKSVQQRTTLLLTRFRYHIFTRAGGDERTLLAEDAQILAFRGSPQNAQWQEQTTAESLLTTAPHGNVLPEQAVHFVDQVVENFEALWPYLHQVAQQRGGELLAAHQRVRMAARIKGTNYRVEPVLPPDVLGIYVYLPV
jgi:superfamily II DNA or RNA helicase